MPKHYLMNKHYFDIKKIFALVRSMTKLTSLSNNQLTKYSFIPVITLIILILKLLIGLKREESKFSLEDTISL